MNITNITRTRTYDAKKKNGQPPGGYSYLQGSRCIRCMVNQNMISSVAEVKVAGAGGGANIGSTSSTTTGAS